MFSRFVDWLADRVACSGFWQWLPAPVWFLVASPLLGWALGVGLGWSWPHGCSFSPLRRSFWLVRWAE